MVGVPAAGWVLDLSPNFGLESGEGSASACTQTVPLDGDAERCRSG